ncbi:Ig-like domain-containing protein, partial [Candidatus Accumulibacter aalborgensis]|uniref:Ig-like domain-containing protein n=1 Tax=Candidatus Accumulibacter aalborgensis TaxID=1860102 RepID=UPI000AA54B9A
QHLSTGHDHAKRPVTFREIRNYLQIDPTALKDSTDHSYAGISDHTTLNFKAVDSVPTLNGSNPSDNGNLEFNQDISLYFSENVHAGTGTLRLYQADGTVVESFDVASGIGGAGGLISFGGKGVIVNPGADLLAGTDYYLQIDPTAVKDSTGQSYAGISDHTTLNFKAVDSVPALYGSDPSDNGTMEFNRDINLYFSEAIHAGTGTLRLYQADGAVVERFDVATGVGDAGGSLSFNGSSVDINPKGDLLPGTDYYLQIDPTALKDSTDHSYAGISDKTTLNFKAVDSVPTLSWSDPSDNGTMEFNRDIVLHFSENIHAGTGTIRLYQADGSLVESFNVATGVGAAGGSVDFNGSWVDVNPKADLLPGTDYYVQIDPTAVKDSTNHNYAGIGDHTTLNLKAVDSAPRLSGSDPSDNGTMEYNRDISLFFSENIHAGTGTIRLYQSDGSLAESFDVATGVGGAGGSVDFNGSWVDVSPKADLLPGTDYYVQIDPTAVKDSTNHSYAGIGDHTTLNFKAVDSVPRLSGSDPSDNGTMEFDRNLSLWFSENIHAGTGTIRLYQADGTVVESFDVATGMGGAGGSVSFGKLGQGVSVNPGADLLPGTDYYLQIDPTAVKDSTNHSYAGISDNATLNFRAVDSVPTLSSSYPSTIEFDHDIILPFSESVHAGTGTIRLFQADGTVVESFDVATGVGGAGGSVGFNGSLVYVDPKADLLSGTDYYVQIEPTAVKDSSEQSYAGIGDNTTLNFKAVDSVPTLFSSYPSDNGTLYMDYSQDISLFFSENIHAGTGTVRLYQANGSLVESFDVATGMGGAGGSVSFNGQRVDVSPKADRLSGTDYYLQIDPTAVKDSSGQSYAGIGDSTALNFKAVDSAPTLSGSYPSDNGTLPVQGNLQLVFSENVHAGTGTIRLYQADGSLVEGFDVATGMGGAGGAVSFNFPSRVEVNPNADLVPGTDYYLEVDPSAVQDATGNFFAGIVGVSTLNFEAI